MGFWGFGGASAAAGFLPTPGVRQRQEERDVRADVARVAVHGCPERSGDQREVGRQILVRLPTHVEKPFRLGRAEVVPCDESLGARPMLRVIQPLARMGATITGQVGKNPGEMYPPLIIQAARGPLAVTSLSGSVISEDARVVIPDPGIVFSPVQMRANFCKTSSATTSTSSMKTAIS